MGLECQAKDLRGTFNIICVWDKVCSFQQYVVVFLLLKKSHFGELTEV